MTVIHNAGTQTAIFRRAILANLVTMDDEGEALPGSDFQVAIEGDGLFGGNAETREDLDSVACDLGRLGRLVHDATMAAGRRSVSRLRLDGFDFADAPRCDWKVDAQMEGGKLQERVTASCDAIALVHAALEMTGVDGSDGMPMSLVARFEGAADKLVNAVFQSPIPEVVSLPWIEEAVSVLERDYPGPETDAILTSGLGDRFGPADAADGDVAIAFASEEPWLDATDMTVVVPAVEFAAEVGVLTGDDVAVDKLLELIQSKAKDVAGRHVDYDSFDSDSDYLDRLDRIVDGLSIVEMGKVGIRRPCSIEATYYGDPDEGTFEEVVQAVDQDDAVFQATLVMSDARAKKGDDAFEMLDEHFGAHEIEATLVRYDPEIAVERMRELSSARTDRMPLSVTTLLDDLDYRTQAFEAVLRARSGKVVDGPGDTLRP